MNMEANYKTSHTTNSVKTTSEIAIPINIFSLNDM